MKLGAERLGRYISRFGFGQTLGAGLPRRDRRHRLEPGAARRERARLGVDGLSGRRHAAADGDRGQLDRQRRASCSSRASSARSSRTATAMEVPHKVRAPRRSTPETAATLTTIMEAGRRARHREERAQIRRATRSPARPGRPRNWSTATTQKSDYNASFVGFVPSRKPALTILVVIDSPHGEGLLRRRGLGARVQADRRSRAAAISASARPSTRRRRCSSRATIRPTMARPHPVTAPSGRAAAARAGSHGLMPDLRGLSAREALRTLTRIGLTAAHERRRLRRRAAPGRGQRAGRSERSRAR